MLAVQASILNYTMRSIFYTMKASKIGALNHPNKNHNHHHKSLKSTHPVV